MVIPFEPGRVDKKDCPFSFSYEGESVFRTIVLAAGKMSLFSRLLEVSRKREFLIYP